MTMRPLDRAGAETLEIMQAAPQYNRWQFSRVAPYLGRRICEVGAGIGNMSTLIFEKAPDLLVLTDTEPYYREALENRFGHSSQVVVEQLTLPDAAVRDRFRHYNLDTVIALNVVEHIDDDLGALKCMASMLRPSGRAIVLVPALPSLFGSLDQELGHARRYTRDSLGRLMISAGFRVQRMFYFNLVGIFGWWLNSRVRKVSRIPIQQLRYFDAMVPLLRLEDRLSLPLGQSLIAIGAIGV